MKKYFVVLLILISTIFLSGYKRPDKFHIDAITNASRHNILGTEYVRERCYYAAIQEFKIAISLNPNSQASSVYYNNLGEVYMKLGFPVEAQDCFERALKLYGLNFLYYQNLAKCYKQMKMEQKMISRYKISKNPLDKVMLGLLYAESGQTRMGIMTLDDFCMREPDLILTHGVKNYLRDLTKR